MATRSGVTDTDYGYADLKRAFQELGGGATVVVGIRQDRGAVKYQEGERESRLGPGRRTGKKVVLGKGTKPSLTVAEVATINEFGSHAHNVPERSFMRSTFDENRPKYERFLQKSILATIKRDRKAGAVGSGAGSIVGALRKLGARVVRDIQVKIRKGPFAPNAPLTIARKGSSKPLLDSGRLRASIDSQVLVAGRPSEEEAA